MKHYPKAPLFFLWGKSCFCHQPCAGFLLGCKLKRTQEEQFISLPPNDMPKLSCPSCFYTRFWHLRRGARKCKKCRKEYRIGTHPVAHVRSTEKEWLACIHAFLLVRSIRAVKELTDLGQSRIEKMLTHLRMLMTADTPLPFEGVCESDETFIGGQRKNKRLHIRRLEKSKRGHGTTKIPIVGVLSRRTGQVAVKVLQKRSETTVIGFIVSQLNKKKAILYTDGYKMNRAVRKHGIRHFYVNHRAGEYVRGTIHTNGIEGFWGYLKRHLAMIGGIRHERFPLFVGEITWRYNNRHLTLKEKEQALLELVLGQ